MYYQERFPFILDDLKQLHIEKPIILEGAAFFTGVDQPISGEV